MLRRGNQAGRLAKKLIRRVGDADVAPAGTENRPEALKSLKEAEIQEIRAAVRVHARSLEEEIAELRTEIDSRAEWRERRAEHVKDKVEQGRLWRGVGVQERIPLGDLSHAVHNVVLAVLAGPDFIVVAQAYAVLADVGLGVGWWFGCLVGVAACVVGLFLARAIKMSSLARVQATMLKDADAGRLKIDPAVRERLVVSRGSVRALLLTATGFIMLGAAGVLVRTQGSATGGESTVLAIFQVLIPLVAVAVEFHLYDPIERDEPAPNAADRRLELKWVKAERRRRILAAQVEANVALIEKLYRVEEAILEVDRPVAHRPGSPDSGRRITT